MEIMAIITSMDFIIWLIVGAIAGFLAGQIMKGSGLIGTIVIGIMGSLIGGITFDLLDFMDVGDVADPIIAGVVGAVIILAIVGLIRRQGENVPRSPE